MDAGLVSRAGRLRTGGGLGRCSLRGIGIAALLALFPAGCVSVATPRAQDASAPGEYIAAGTHRNQRCEPPIEVVPAAAQANRPYHEVASLSATCYPGLPAECERHLLERACELGADAIILKDEASGSPPWGSPQSRVSRSANAVRWLEKGSP